MSGGFSYKVEVTYTRISKRMARKLWAKGDTHIYIIPHKLRPGGMNESGMLLAWISGIDFDAKVSEFTDLNCASEVGYYPAFYVMRER